MSKQVQDRQVTAARLLASSAKKSYDPLVEVDWASEVSPHLFGMTPEWSTLFGTPLWDSMSLEQQVTLTIHEASSISATGIWFEMILMQMLLRDMYTVDPAEPHFQFALTEIADECRHSTMFARAATHFGCPHYGPPPLLRELSRVFKSTASGAVAYGCTLVAEEVLDVMQRDFMRDERVQPVTRTISKIHVLEEARHIRFAREETARRAAESSRLQRLQQQAVVGVVSYFVATTLVHPQVYAAAGLDVRTAVAAARANTHHHEKLRSGAAPTFAFLDSVGLVGGPAAALLRRAHLR